MYCKSGKHLWVAAIDCRRGKRFFGSLGASRRRWSLKCSWQQLHVCGLRPKCRTIALSFSLLFRWINTPTQDHHDSSLIINDAQINLYVCCSKSNCSFFRWAWHPPPPPHTHYILYPKPSTELISSSMLSYQVCFHQHIKTLKLRRTMRHSREKDSPLRCSFMNLHQFGWWLISLGSHLDDLFFSLNIR